ncbi:hypothetical protein CDAR_315651 [Caerostris darwini]|uniref:Uncharacterized protein n=1 Tax=Caerostris darwini TaxID=1538125 RepID=A0AAV4TP22_9ARAC|nr:hypothetical protein CDAR_315651 [Caerostris darwini]
MKYQNLLCGRSGQICMTLMYDSPALLTIKVASKISAVFENPFPKYLLVVHKGYGVGKTLFIIQKILAQLPEWTSSFYQSFARVGGRI